MDERAYEGQGALRGPMDALRGPMDAAQRERYIPAALKQQEMVISNTEKLVEELSARLDAVMSMPKEVTGAGIAGNQTADDRPPLAITLSQNAARISSINTKLERIMRRLEV